MSHTEYPHLQTQDPDLFATLAGEATRQAEGLELIPSENYASLPVREAIGSVFTNKYSEGYPGRRYYGGQEYTDEMEKITIERAKALFGAQYANVQPLSGAIANMAMYFALLEPGDTVLGMDLSHGGHLTHGHPTTWINRIFNFVRYRMKDVETGEIDYEALRETALRERPKIILAGFSSYPRDLDYERFVAIAREVGAYAVADVAHIAGLIAGGVLKNPFDAGFDVMTSTTHKTLRGPRGGLILTRADESLAKKIDKTVFPGVQGGPHMNLVAAKGVAFHEAATPAFRAYAAKVVENAAAMANVLTDAGWTLVTGGTSNHLILADVHRSLGVTGKEAEEVLDSVGITCNKNVVPDDPRSALDPSGVRFGTPAMTTRGMGTAEAASIARIMAEAITHRADQQKLAALRAEVRQLAAAFPVPERFV